MSDTKKTTKVGTPKLPPRVHIQEYLFDKGLSDMQKAGFLAYVDRKLWMRPNEWDKALEDYKTRDERGV
jgi:hypothetical protein